MQLSLLLGKIFAVNIACQQFKRFHFRAMRLKFDVIHISWNFPDMIWYAYFCYVTYSEPQRPFFVITIILVLKMLEPTHYRKMPSRSYLFFILKSQNAKMKVGGAYLTFPRFSTKESWFGSL